MTPKFYSKQERNSIYKRILEQFDIIQKCSHPPAKYLAFQLDQYFALYNNTLDVNDFPEIIKHKPKEVTQNPAIYDGYWFKEKATKEAITISRNILLQAIAETEDYSNGKTEIRVLPSGGNGILAFTVNSGKFPKECITAVKLAIEKEINNPPYVACEYPIIKSPLTRGEIENEWAKLYTILTYFWEFEKGVRVAQKEPTNIIRSIRRILDGAEFMVDEKVMTTYFGEQQIDSFYKDKNEVLTIVFKTGHNAPLWDISKMPEPPGKPWEILKLCKLYGSYGTYITPDKNNRVRYAAFSDCSIEDAIKNRGYNIYEVRRKDGKVIELNKTIVKDPNTKHIWTVSEISLKGSDIFLNGVEINHVEVAIMITEDGFPVFKGGVFYWIKTSADHWDIHTEIASGITYSHPHPFKTCKYFSSRDKASQYKIANWNGISDYQKKPPLGPLPEIIWKQRRLAEICEAIFAYSLIPIVIPDQLIEERQKLRKELYGSENNMDQKQPSAESGTTDCKGTVIIETGYAQGQGDGPDQEYISKVKRSDGIIFSLRQLTTKGIIKEFKRTFDTGEIYAIVKDGISINSYLLEEITPGLC